MQKTRNSNNHAVVRAQPRLHQNATEIQPYGTVISLLPLELEEAVRLEMTERLNQLLADTITLRDLYKKSHWQVAGPTFYQLHLLFDKHFQEQSELVDAIAERIQLLGVQCNRGPHSIDLLPGDIVLVEERSRTENHHSASCWDIPSRRGSYSTGIFGVVPMALYALECRDF